MGKGNRNNRKQRRNRQSGPSRPSNNGVQSAQKPEPMTPEKVVASTSNEEFQANKEALIQELMTGVETLESERRSIEEQKSSAESELVQLEQRKSDLKREIDELESSLEEARETIRNAEDEAARIRTDADAYAEEIQRSADEDRLNTLADTAKQAKKAWQEYIDDLTEQWQEITDREAKLLADQRDVDKARRFVEDEKEAISELKEDLARRRNRYDAASPAKVAALETTVADERARYEALRERYKELSERLSELQSYVDSMKAELSEDDGEGQVITAGEIIRRYKDLRERHEKLSSLYVTYPNSEAIGMLEDKARRADQLEKENAVLLAERNRYRDEAMAAENERQELSAVRSAVLATRALNDHLLCELESHKAALESRSGDPCESLSKVDEEVKESPFIAEIGRRSQRPSFQNLKSLVDHVRNYAGSRPASEQLYYTADDIRAFLAGMAVSHLVILQGMSGTGKSSLPRIFAEAISGFNKLIPVESSWRDRNELLGYYNDFNKKFNAKPFTVELYRSGKEECKDIPTFIVLDEMNLARIEYYFSDFLTVLEEPDHKKWLVELVSSDLRSLPVALPDEVKSMMMEESPSAFSIWQRIEMSRQGHSSSDVSEKDRQLLFSYLGRIGRLMGAKDLVDGRRIRITDNIWFVGTANRDESTFEISDKVYDRAQVISLNKKGVPESRYTKVNQGYISATHLQKLFSKAIHNNDVKTEVELKLDDLDDTLMTDFDTSFGNRIVSQASRFAAVFMAAGGSLEDALDYQISTKIIRKIITSDDESALLNLRAKVANYDKSTRLLEKRLRELSS